MIIRISELRNELEKLLNLTIPVLLVGETGIGKTSTIRELPWSSFIIRGSSVVPEMIALVGLDGRITINPAIRESELVFIDELNQAPGFVQNYLTQLIDFCLIEGKKVVAAINIGSSYEVFEIPGNVAARFAILNLIGDTLYLENKYKELNTLVRVLSSKLNLSGESLHHKSDSPRQLEYFLKYAAAYGIQAAAERAEFFFSPNLAAHIKAARFDKILNGNFEDLNVLEVSLLVSILPPEQLVKAARWYIDNKKFELAEIIISKLEETDPKLASQLKAVMQAKMKK